MASALWPPFPYRWHSAIRCWTSPTVPIRIRHPPELCTAASVYRCAKVRMFSPRVRKCPNERMVEYLALKINWQCDDNSLDLRGRNSLLIACIEWHLDIVMYCSPCMEMHISLVANGKSVWHRHRHIRGEHVSMDAICHLRHMIRRFFGRQHRRHTHSPNRHRMWPPHDPAIHTQKTLGFTNITGLTVVDIPEPKNNCQIPFSPATVSSAPANVLDCTHPESPKLLYTDSAHYKIDGIKSISPIGILLPIKL